MADSTSDHNKIEHMAADIRVFASDIIPGVGFTINAYSPLRLTKTFKVRWNWS